MLGGADCQNIYQNLTTNAHVGIFAVRMSGKGGGGFFWFIRRCPFAMDAVVAVCGGGGRRIKTFVWAQREKGVGQCESGISTFHPLPLGDWRLGRKGLTRGNSMLGARRIDSFVSFSVVPCLAASE